MRHNGSVLVRLALLVRVDADEEVHTGRPEAPAVLWRDGREGELGLAELESMANGGWELYDHDLDGQGDEEDRTQSGKGRRHLWQHAVSNEIA
jgi:hypothetical protein